ncbi:MAG TPA: Do family serine endopeptidase [Pirellulales bacterium]|nr:Do family serine endopeptidase [Pirellulales bacterium]
MERTFLKPRNRAWAVVAVATAMALGGAVWQRHSVAEDRAPAPDVALEHADQLSHAFRKAAEHAIPTVVTIETRTKPRMSSGKGRQFQGENPLGGENPFKGTPFEDFFNDKEFQFHSGPGQNGRSFQAPGREGMGSGVIIDKSGIVLTNNHVVSGADEVTVRLSDGRKFTATDIKTDPETDLAVLRIKADESLPAAKLGDSDKLQIGDWVIAVGNPFGLNSTVSAGIISGKGRELESNKRASFIQTDAAINPGNSGGPLLTLKGEVVGINTAIASNSGGYQGIGFAIPSNQAKWVMSQLIENGVVKRAYLGVAIREVSGELADQLGVGGKHGVLVQEVSPNSPAAKAGFEAGDVITEYAGKAVHSPRDLQHLVERTEVESKQAVKVLRDGKPVELSVVVKPLPAEGSHQLGSSQSDHRGGSHHGYKSDELGVEVAELTKDNAEQFGFADYKGVVITEVDAESAAARAGLSEGMLIMKVGAHKVESVEEFKAAVKDASLDKGVLLLARTQDGNRFLVLKR